MYKNKYTYPELVRVEKNDIRYYRDSKENLVPSVTTISAEAEKIIKNIIKEYLII